MVKTYELVNKCDKGLDSREVKREAQKLNQSEMKQKMTTNEFKEIISSSHVFTNPEFTNFSIF